MDEYVLRITPLLLGTGSRGFPAGARIPLEVTNSVTTTTGVMIAAYRDPVRGEAHRPTAAPGEFEGGGDP